MPNLFSLFRGQKRCCAPFTTVLVCVEDDKSLSDVDTEDLETLDPLHYGPIDVNGGFLGPPFPVLHNLLLCLADVEGEVAVLSSHCQVSDRPLWAGCVNW